MTKKNKETVSLMRTYKFSSKEVNQGKLDRVIAVSKEYRKYYNTLMRVEFFKYYQTGEMPKFLEIIGATNLSKRYY